MDSRFHTVDSRFHVCGFRILHPWIPDSMDSISWIPDSTDQNYLDSGFRITLHGAISYLCPFLLVSKRIYFDVRVNYLHCEVEWSIKTEFVIENLNIHEMQKQTCEHVNLKYRKIIMLTNTKAKEMGHKYEVMTI